MSDRVVGDVQLIPPGLLGLFQLKSIGRNPDQLAGFYQPCLDMVEWLMQARALDSRFDLGGIASVSLPAGSGAFNFNTNSIGVPANEIWYVLDFTCQVSLVAGETADFQPCYMTPGAALAPYALGTRSRLAGTAVGTLNVVRAEKPFWLPSGSVLGVFVSEQISAANLNYQGFWRYVRIPK